MSKKWRPPRTNRVSEAVFRAPKSRWDRELLQAEYGSLALRSYFHKSSGCKYHLCLFSSFILTVILIAINRIAQQGKIIAICRCVNLRFIGSHCSPQSSAADGGDSDNTLRMSGLLSTLWTFVLIKYYRTTQSA